jgi:hypothetical protein
MKKKIIYAIIEYEELLTSTATGIGTIIHCGGGRNETAQ